VYKFVYCNVLMLLCLATMFNYDMQVELVRVGGQLLSQKFIIACMVLTTQMVLI